MFLKSYQCSHHIRHNDAIWEQEDNDSCIMLACYLNGLFLSLSHFLC